LLFEKSNNGDPFKKFDDGWRNKKQRNEITENDPNLYHTTKERYNNMLNFKEGYYYQPHYRIPVKTVSRDIKTDKAIEYEITEFNIMANAFTEVNRQLFEIKTSDGNFFNKNDKIVLYKRSTNEYFFITVYNIIDLNKFTCVIADEKGNHIHEIDTGDINDYVLVKKHEGTPDYARLIKDGSCRYCWREIISNGIESDERIYPFTNGAFYINRQINFFLRRQDPQKINLGYRQSPYDYVPDGENIKNYPNYNPYYETNYGANEIEQC
jgi:hypothetical protein